MNRLDTRETFQKLQQDSRLLVTEYGSETCPPCRALKTKIDMWASERSDVNTIYVSIGKFPDLAAQNGVLSAPTVALYWEGRELLKQSGYFSLDLFLEKVERIIDSME